MGQIKSRVPLIGVTLSVAALLAIIVWLRSGSDSEASASGPLPTKAFYSVDDGASYFAAPRQIPPFEYQGKSAVQAFVFEKMANEVWDT